MDSSSSSPPQDAHLTRTHSRLFFVVFGDLHLCRSSAAAAAVAVTATVDGEQCTCQQHHVPAIALSVPCLGEGEREGEEDDKIKRKTCEDHNNNCVWGQALAFIH